MAHRKREVFQDREIRAALKALRLGRKGQVAVLPNDVRIYGLARQVAAYVQTRKVYG